MQAAIDDLWMYTGELFESDEIDQAIAGEGLGRISRRCTSPGSASRDDGRGGDADPAAAGMGAAGGKASIPSISATSWPISSSCSGPIPTRHGEEPDAATAA